MKKNFRNVLAFFHTPNWLFVLLSSVVVLRIPSFFEPYSYGDEMIYLTLGNAVRKGIGLYNSVHDNKPPLLYLTAAVAGNLFWFKVILALWSLVTIFIFWKLANRLFLKNDALQKISTVIFATLTTIPLLEGNIVNSEVFMIGPTILAFYILLDKKVGYKKIFIAGLLFSVSALFKFPAAFDVPAAVFLWLITARFNKKGVVKLIKQTVVLIGGFATPIVLTFVCYAARGAFHEYLVAAFLQNFGYLSSWRPADTQKPFLVKNGPLLIRATIVAVGGLILFIKRRSLSKKFTFISFWLLLTLFAVTLSERPYPHYLIQSVAPGSLLLGMLFAYKNIEQVLTIIPLTLAFFVPVYYKFWHYPTTTYYLRFINLVSKNITKEDYLNSFGGNTIRNYKTSHYINLATSENDKVFVWGDNTTIYALSKRFPPIKYVADYHIKDFSSNDEVISALSNDLPKLIVVTPDGSNFPELANLIQNNYFQIEDIQGAKIYKLLSSENIHYIAP